jgi:hypothetical protein
MPFQACRYNTLLKEEIMNLFKSFMGTRQFLIAAGFVIASFILLSSCNEQTNLQSKWRDKDIIIDGHDNEWQNCQLYTDPITGTNMGIYNDDAYVYICFSTMDIDIQKAIVRQGFVIWFDETGGKHKALGVRYPIGASSGSGSGNNTYSVKELQMLTSETDTGKTLKVREAVLSDVNARIATDQSGKFIYELKMPLIKSSKTPYAVVPSRLNKIGVGFMTVKATGRTTGGKSGFGGSISEIGANSGGNSDSIKDSDEGGIMGSRVIDNDDPALGKVTVMPNNTRATKGKSFEIWTNVLLASRP